MNVPPGPPQEPWSDLFLEDTGLLQLAALCFLGLRVSFSWGGGHEVGSAAAVWKTVGFILTATRIYPVFQA